MIRVHVLDTQSGILMIHHAKKFNCNGRHEDSRYRIMMAVDENNKIIYKEQRKPSQLHPRITLRSSPLTIKEMYNGKTNGKSRRSHKE